MYVKLSFDNQNRMIFITKGDENELDQSGKK